MQDPPCRMLPSDTTTRRIVVVGDDLTLQDGMVGYLQGIDYEVSRVRSAFEFFKRTDCRSFDLAILHVSAPDRGVLALSGYLRNVTGTRILMISEHASVEERLEGYRSGADLFMVGPVDFRDLAGAIAGLLQRLGPRSDR
ncbi:MAG: response regulator transcription factor [Chlorobiaceae bacterium]|nr:response regulator transcription factor [Chlorobiaceae bacterium]NTW74143.1 response regulator transcription factor [Chlorobiaceae bacterium]